MAKIHTKLPNVKVSYSARQPRPDHASIFLETTEILDAIWYPQITMMLGAAIKYSNHSILISLSFSIFATKQSIQRGRD